MSKAKGGKKQTLAQKQGDKKKLKGGRPRYHQWGIVGAILFVTLFTYLPSLKNDWTNWDDPTYVTENPALIGHNWSSLLCEPFSLNYHPVTMISLGIDHAVWGADAFGYHLTNLLWHLLATALVFFLVRRLAPARTWFTAIFAALLFGIHPLHVESVAWISERKDVLYVSFFLAGLLSYLQYLKKLDNKWLGITFICFVLSVLSKAMAVVFPVILLLIDWYRADRPLRGRVLLEKIPFLLVSLLFGLMAVRIQSQGAIADMETFGLYQRLSFAAYGFVFYLIKAVVPFQMATFYPYPDQAEAASMFYYAMPVVALALLILPFLWWKKDRSGVFGMLFYLITVALVLQFLSVGRAIMADRYTYLPYVGIFFALGYYLDKWAVGKLRISIWAASAAFALVMATICYKQISVWKNSETLWTQVIRHFPDRADEAYANRATYRGKNGRMEEALEDARQALMINARHANALSTQGNILASQGQFEAALESFNRAITEKPDDFKYYQNRAITFANLGRFAEARADFQKAIDLSKGLSPGVFTNKGFMEINQGQFAAGLSDCQQAYRLQPNDPGTNYCLALAHLRNGNVAEARSFGQRAMQLGYPLSPEMQQQLGL